MKAISLWQPWASAIALGAKRVETRSWATNYRGPIAIHAAKRCIDYEMCGIKSSWTWCGVLRPLGIRMGNNVDPVQVLPFGAIVAIAKLADCRPSESFTNGELDSRRMPDGETLDIYGWTERMMGDYSHGRFGWILTNIVPLAKPVPYRGAQGLFQVPDSLLARAA